MGSYVKDLACLFVFQWVEKIVKQVINILPASFYIYACMHTCVQVPFNQTLRHPSTAPVQTTLVSLKPEKMFQVPFSRDHLSSLLHVSLIVRRSVPTLATGLCPCHADVFLNMIIIIQLLLRHRAMLVITLLFIKDIWSSLCNMPLGKAKNVFCHGNAV